nr:MAG TPA: hypothetical protein [Caudoviricetes sp.]
MVNMNNLSEEEKKAIEILKWFKDNEIQRDKLEIDNRCGGWKIGRIYKSLELNTAIETVLFMLEEKDKIIDLMAEKIFEEGIVWKNKEEVKQYFENKAKELLNK